MTDKKKTPKGKNDLISSMNYNDIYNNLMKVKESHQEIEFDEYLKLRNSLNNKIDNLEDVWQENRRIEVFDAIKKRLDEFETIEEKIKFLSRQKADYLQNLDIKTLVASGDVVRRFGLNDEVFLDKLLSTEISHWKTLLEIENKEIDFHIEDKYNQKNDIQFKVSALDYIGVIDFLMKSTSNVNPSYLGRILAPILNGTPDSIRKAIDRIVNEENEPYNTEKIKHWIETKKPIKIKKD
jgi:flagellar biosynthesis chaperone FliJ